METKYWNIWLGSGIFTTFLIGILGVFYGFSDWEGAYRISGITTILGALVWGFFEGDLIERNE